jgi:methylase of polypeptide subunit release factors
MTLAAFGPVTIEADLSVLTPRQWTLAQSTWAGELASGLPAGPILELCCGAGQIGLAAAQLTGRALVQVDRAARACAWARRNADGNGIASDIRNASVDDALADHERFALVIADPPYLRSSEVARYPEDPPLAIDGGPDGLALIDRCLSVAARHTIAGAVLLLQVRGPNQADAVRDLARTRRLPFVLEAVRAEADERAVVLLRRLAELSDEFLDTGAG